MKKPVNYDDYYGTLKYYGVWDVTGNFHVDIERFDKTIGFYINDVKYVKSLADDGGILYPNDEKPKHYDMITKELSNLRSMWRNEYLPLLDCIKTPKQVENDTRLSMLCYTSDMDDFDEICSESMIAGVRRMIAYENILRTIYLQYFSMTISKCEQLIYKLICDCGYADDEFSFKKYLEFLEKKNINNDDLANSQEFDGMRKIYNFLKHGTKDTFNKLKKSKYANDQTFLFHRFSPYRDKAPFKNFIPKFIFLFCSVQARVCWVSLRLWQKGGFTRKSRHCGNVNPRSAHSREPH